VVGGDRGALVGLGVASTSRQDCAVGITQRRSC
jgi:hypothetical protein